MKKKLAAVLVVIVAAFVMVAAAVAHNGALAVSATCNTQTGNYDVVWTVTADTAGQGPIKIFASNRASIPVGTVTGTSKTFTESVAGTTTFISAAITLRWDHDGFKANGSASKELAGNCKKPTPPPPPYDACPNLEGNQATVPAGLIKDAQGNCVTPPVTPPPPPQQTRQGYCDPATGEYLNLFVGQDKVEPYASRHLVPAVAGSCPQVNIVVPPKVVPPVAVPPEAPKAKPPVKITTKKVAIKHAKPKKHVIKKKHPVKKPAIPAPPTL